VLALCDEKKYVEQHSSRYANIQKFPAQVVISPKAIDTDLLTEVPSGFRSRAEGQLMLSGVAVEKLLFYFKQPKLGG
jgi:hypothetical protein